MEPDQTPYPVLKFLSEFAEIYKTLNHLPHWQQDRSTYFLTFRLGDSIPAVLLSEWRRARDQWCLEHPKPWSSATEDEYHQRFSTVIDRLLDQGYGSCLFRDSANADIVTGAFRHFDHRRYLLHSWVIMPNHMHLLLTHDASIPLARIAASWKRFTATKIHQRNQSSGRMWQKDYFDRIIRDWDHFMNVARYIRRNPLKAKLPDGAFLLEEAAWVKRLLS